MKQCVPPLLARGREALRARGRARGVTVTEFAIISPLALLLVMGLVQVGFMLVAKQVVNEAAFIAARAGAMNNGSETSMKIAAGKALIPFYQDATNASDNGRITAAVGNATVDLAQPWNLKIDRLNPTPAAFDDFGLSDGKGKTYIPNDSLEYRRYIAGAKSGLSIQDANALKVRVTYAYELKVPLMKAVFKSVMCGLGTGVDGFGNDSVFNKLASVEDCARYYVRGRVPIVAYATVQMQSPAYR